MEHSHKLLKQAIAAGLALGMAHGALANEDKITKGFYSMDAMGCMLLKECTNGVERINSSIDLMNAYPDCLLYTSPSPRDYAASRMPSSA